MNKRALGTSFCIFIFYVITVNCDDTKKENANYHTLSFNSSANVTFNGQTHEQMLCAPKDACEKYGYKENTIVYCVGKLTDSRVRFNCSSEHFKPPKMNFGTKYEIMRDLKDKNKGLTNCWLNITLIDFGDQNSTFSAFRMYSFANNAAKNIDSNAKSESEPVELNVSKEKNSQFNIKDSSPLKFKFESSNIIKWNETANRTQIECRPLEYCSILEFELDGKCEFKKWCNYTVNINCTVLPFFGYKTHNIPHCDVRGLDKVDRKYDISYRIVCLDHYEFDNCWLNMTITSMQHVKDRTDYLIIGLVLGFLTFAAVIGILTILGHRGVGPLKMYMKTK